MLKAFIFDLGNVLLLFSHQRMFAQVGALCGKSGDDVRRVFIDDDLGTRFERGDVSETELRAELQRRLDATFDRDQLDRALGDIFTPNEPMLRIVDELRRRGFRLVLLSNTNSIHVRWIQSHYDVLGKFDDCVLSYEVRAVKPEAAIFQRAIDCARCTPSECFYTDDIADYVAAGRRSGLNSGVFTDATTFRQQLVEYGVDLAAE